jgi:outer membrane protein TolC
MKYLLTLIFSVLLIFNSQGQGIDTLQFEVFLEWIKNYHPLARQAEIQLRLGDMQVRTARGGFDPLLYGNLDKKDYNETLYYDKREAGLSIPTWAGIELNGTFEQNSGYYLNPESTVPNGGLFAAGASVNVGQGLIMDERRAALRQAQIYQDATQVERQKMLNELYLKGFEAYWNWSLTYANLQAIQEAVELTQFRYEGIIKSFEQGDVAAIDTVEAYTQLLNRQYRLENAQNQFFTAGQILNSFLWNEEEEPMILDPLLIPSDLSEEIDHIVDPEELRNAVGAHPDLQLVNYEIAGLEIDKKLKGQSILPVVKLKYNFLVESMDGFEQSQFFENNYKFGVSVYTPLLWRKARGSLGMTKAKIDIKENSRELKELQLRTKLESEINNLKTIGNQVSIYDTNVGSLERLLAGEMRKFEIGESSLFLVNAREVSVFDSRLTLNELLAKYQIAIAKTRVAAGLGFQY